MSPFVMDQDSLIRKLTWQCIVLSEVIDSLKALQPEVREALQRRGKKRGRKSMSMEERRMVSERVKKYWASWREARRNLT